MSGTAVWRCLLLLLFRDATARISLPRSGELPMRTKPLIAAASAHKDLFVSSSSSCSSPDVRRRQTLKSLPNIELSCSSIWPQPLQKAISIRGGAKKAPKKNVANALTSAVQDVTPTTRMYLLGCLAIALLTMIGIPEELLLFEPVRTFKMLQLWRPITSACHLGKVDMSMAQQVYFLIQYGQQMERSDGSAQHAVFLATQLVLLCFFCTLLGVPTLSRPLITASIYCCSRRQPMMPMEIQFGLKIEYWLLPYINMIIDCLQAQSAAGAVPHIIGIFTGHVYHFFSVIWPKMGGRRFLAAPGALEAAISGGGKDSKATKSAKSGFVVDKKPASSKRKKGKGSKGKKSKGKSKKRRG